MRHRCRWAATPDGGLICTECGEKEARPLAGKVIKDRFGRTFASSPNADRARMLTSNLRHALRDAVGTLPDEEILKLVDEEFIRATQEV